MITLTFANMTITLPEDDMLYVLESSFVRYYGRADGFTNTYQNRNVYFMRDTYAYISKVQVMFA